MRHVGKPVKVAPEYCLPNALCYTLLHHKVDCYCTLTIQTVTLQHLHVLHVMSAKWLKTDKTVMNLRGFLLRMSNAHTISYRILLFTTLSYLLDNKYK